MLPRRVRELLSDVAVELEAELKRSSLLLRDLLNRQVAFTKLLEDLRAQRLRLGQGVSSSTEGGDGETRAEGSAQADGSSGLPDLNRELLLLGINSPAFERTNAAIVVIGALIDRDRKLGALTEAFSSDSWLIQRYVRFREEKLVAKHALFALLKPILYLDCALFGYAAAVRSNGSVPELARNFAWGEKEQIAQDQAAIRAGEQGKAVRFGSLAASQKILFLHGQFPRQDRVNAPGGYLELARILDGSDSVDVVVMEEHYCNVITLKGMQKFYSPLFTCTGYAQFSTGGDSWFTHLAVYIEFMEAGENFQGDDLRSHKLLCTESFQSDDRLMRDLHAERLSGSDPTSTARRFDFLLPFDTPGKLRLQERLTSNEQQAKFREAAGLKSAKRNYSLNLPRSGNTNLRRPGHRSGSPYPSDASRSRSGSPSLRSSASRESLNSMDSHMAAPRSVSVPAPGSKAHLVKWNGSETRFTVGDVTRTHSRVDAKGAAEKLGLKLADFCPESLFSTKQGDARFALCTRWGQPGHESCKSSAHVTPDGWDGPSFHRDFVTVVTPSGSSNRAGRTAEPARRDEERKSDRRMFGGRDGGGKPGKGGKRRSSGNDRPTRA